MAQILCLLLFILALEAALHLLGLDHLERALLLSRRVHSLMALAQFQLLALSCGGRRARELLTLFFCLLSNFNVQPSWHLKLAAFLGLPLLPNLGLLLDNLVILSLLLLLQCRLFNALVRQLRREAKACRSPLLEQSFGLLGWHEQVCRVALDHLKRVVVTALRLNQLAHDSVVLMHFIDWLVSIFAWFRRVASDE